METLSHTVGTIIPELAATFRPGIRTGNSATAGCIKGSPPNCYFRPREVAHARSAPPDGAHKADLAGLGQQVPLTAYVSPGRVEVSQINRFYQTVRSDECRTSTP